MIEQERIGSWMQTYTGKQFWPLSPRVEDFDELDIAHALSMTCRYGGHVKHFYSVAEHCWHMSMHVSPEAQLFALMHDAAEAYVGDMVRPLKQNMPDFKEAELGILSVMWSWLFDRGVRVPAYTDDRIEREVNEADNRILLNEKQFLMRRAPEPWFQEGRFEPLPISHFLLWDPPVAERFWLDRFYALTGLEDKRA